MGAAPKRPKQTNKQKTKKQKNSNQLEDLKWKILQKDKKKKMKNLTHSPQKQTKQKNLKDWETEFP